MSVSVTKTTAGATGAKEGPGCHLPLIDLMSPSRGGWQRAGTKLGAALASCHSRGRWVGAENVFSREGASSLRLL